MQCAYAKFYNLSLRFYEVPDPSEAKITRKIMYKVPKRIMHALLQSKTYAFAIRSYISLLLGAMENNKQSGI